MISRISMGEPTAGSECSRDSSCSVCVPGMCLPRRLAVETGRGEPAAFVRTQQAAIKDDDDTKDIYHKSSYKSSVVQTLYEDLYEVEARTAK